MIVVSDFVFMSATPSCW